MPSNKIEISSIQLIHTSSIKTTKIYDRSRIRNLVLSAFISYGTNCVRNVPPVQHIARHITEFSKIILFIKGRRGKGGLRNKAIQVPVHPALHHRPLLSVAPSVCL